MSKRDKVTSGPWAHKWVDTGFAQRWDVASGTIAVASCGQNEANARLIAAAPELLEVLKQFIETHQHTSFGTDVFHAAKAAIAKADGK
jgi:hypothetical protein